VCHNLEDCLGLRLESPSNNIKIALLLLYNSNSILETAFTLAMTSLDILLAQVPLVVKEVADTRPLCQNMTNYVVQNFAANVALAM
jgi:hypothetical protein